MRRALDDSTLLDFGGEFLVVCPHCGLKQYWAAAQPGLLTAADSHRYPAGVVAMGAAVREHARGPHGWSNQALANRLPKWLGDAKNRDDLLRCTERLREKL